MAEIVFMEVPDADCGNKPAYINVMKITSIVHYKYFDGEKQAEGIRIGVGGDSVTTSLTMEQILEKLTRMQPPAAYGAPLAFSPPPQQHLKYVGGSEAETAALNAAQDGECVRVNDTGKIIREVPDPSCGQSHPD